MSDLRFRPPGWCRLAVGLLLANACMMALAAEVDIAVAANFSAPMKRIAERFGRESGHTARLAFGSSGSLYAQIRNGAPFDVFLSADSETAMRLERDGLVVPGSRFTYATGALALWSADPALVDAKGEVLRQGGFARLAVANPKLAPYGKAAMEALRAMGLLATLEAKLVLGENIAQTYQFVASGAAPLGFVALAQVFRDGRIAGGSAWIVPETMYPPIRQDAVLLATAHDKGAAVALLRYLKSDAAREIIRSFGYR